MSEIDPTLQIPWLAAPAAALLRAHAAERLGGGILIEGGAGLGGEWLARWAAARVFCRVAPGASPPCLACLDCRRTFQGQQPDLYLVALERTKRDDKLARDIKIDQLRDLAFEMALTSHAGRAKVAIVSPADRMNTSSANAFLKTLEEPTRTSLLILVAGQPRRLPATIRSRCMRLRIPPPSRPEALEWLQQRGIAAADAAAVLDATGDQPLAGLAGDARAMGRLAEQTRITMERIAAGEPEDPAMIADAWGDENTPQRLAVMENWLTERLRMQVRRAWPGSELRSAAQSADAALSLNARRSFELLDLVRDARSLADSGLNKPMLFERILRRTASLASRRPGQVGPVAI